MQKILSIINTLVILAIIVYLGENHKNFSLEKNAEQYNLGNIQNTNNETIQLSTTVNNLANEVTQLQSKVLDLEFFPSLKDTVTFQPDYEGFQKIETRVGNLYVSLSNIEKYANGHKVTFDVGNPYAADLIMADAKLSYGISYGEYLEKLTEEQKKDVSKNYNDWKATLKTQEKNVESGFSFRAWNKLNFILTPSDPEEIGTLQLTIQAKGLSLLQNTPKN